MSRHPFARDPANVTPPTPDTATLPDTLSTPIHAAPATQGFSTPVNAAYPSHYIQKTTAQLQDLHLGAISPAQPSVGEFTTPDAIPPPFEHEDSVGRRKLPEPEPTPEVMDVGGADEEDEVGEGEDEAVHFVLLAEFDIDLGSTISQQYPYPTGTDEHRLAELMLPDGAHLRAEDWTVFYLGQDHALAIDPLLDSEESPTQTVNKRASMFPKGSRPKRGAVGGGLLYVLSCVRCKADKTAKRGALVKSLAICTPHPWIHVFKPILLLALEEYFRSPSPEVLAHLYDCCNSAQILAVPRLTRAEKIMMRQTDRKDLFEERYEAASAAAREMEMDAAALSAEVEGGLGLVRRDSESSHMTTPSGGASRSGADVGRKGNRDTHYFDVDVRFRRINVPMKIPLSPFDEEVGDYSLVELITTFSNNVTPFPAPFHPYQHSNRAATHPNVHHINALLAHKRVLILGTQYPANHVARTVLSVCALATGCGQVLRGITETALPYCNLSCYEMMEGMNGFVAGVTNPRFVELPCWDVCCDIETGKITVNKNMKAGNAGVMQNRDAEASETSLGSGVRLEGEPAGAGMANTPTAKMTATQKADCVDNQFMEEITAAIGSHYGEMYIRQRMTDYISRFTRLASYQEYQHHGLTKIGYPSTTFRDGRLGSGTVFSDESKKQREMWANGHRIDAWRKTKSYRLFAKDWAREARRRRIPFDIQHQIARLRTGQNMGDAEAEAIYGSFAQNLETYEQALELLKNLPLHLGGLTPIANGLFHRWVAVRESAVDILLSLQSFQLGRQAVAAMNYFHRKAFMQLLERRGVSQHALPANRVDGSRLATRGVEGTPGGAEGEEILRRERIPAS